MKPLGRKPLKGFEGKVDHHIKGFKNWWEVEIGTNENKKGERRKSKMLLRGIK